MKKQKKRTICMNNHNIKKEKCKFQIYSNVEVNAVWNGNNVDVKFSVANPKINIKKISKKEYVNLNTGEIHKFQENERKQNGNLKKTFQKLRQTINCNFSDTEIKNKLFLTLTYKENMQDNKKLYKDTEIFMKKLRYAYKDTEFSYITVAEPQDRGAWHLHIMLKALNKHNLYICNRKLQEMWGHGRTKTKRLKNVDGVGNYYAAYFTNLSKGKKGSRLHMYSVGSKIYRTSRNIIKPVVEKIRYGDLRKEYGEPAYHNAYKILKDDSVVNVVVIEQFKTNKKKSSINYIQERIKAIKAYKEKLTMEYLQAMTDADEEKPAILAMKRIQERNRISKIKSRINYTGNKFEVDKKERPINYIQLGMDEFIT